MDWYGSQQKSLGVICFQEKRFALAKQILKNIGVWCSQYLLCNVTDTACPAGQPPNSDKTACQVPFRRETIIYNIYN